MEATLGVIRANIGRRSVSEACIRKFMILVWLTIELRGSLIFRDTLCSKLSCLTPSTWQNFIES